MSYLRKACCSCPLCRTEHESFVSTRRWRICSPGSMDAVWWRLLPRDGHLLLTAVGSDAMCFWKLPPELLFYLSLSRAVVLGRCCGSLRGRFGLSVTGKHHRHLLSRGTDADILQRMRHASQQRIVQCPTGPRSPTRYGRRGKFYCFLRLEPNYVLHINTTYFLYSFNVQ